jgi:hypothetical protein
MKTVRLITLVVFVVMFGVIASDCVAQAITVQEWAQNYLDEQAVWAGTPQQIFFKAAALPDGTPNKGVSAMEWLLHFTDADMRSGKLSGALTNLYYIILLVHACENLDPDACLEAWLNAIRYNSDRMTEYQIDKLMYRAKETIREANNDAKQVHLPYNW